MQKVLSSIVAVGVCVATVTAPLVLQPTWAQSQNDQKAELRKLIDQAVQQTNQGQPLQAIETLKQALALARQLKDRDREGIALLGIGLNYDNTGQPQQALDYDNQALTIFRDDLLQSSFTNC